MLVSPTKAGSAVIDELFPRFNQFEVDLTTGLSPTDRTELSRLLRIVINNASVDEQVAHAEP